MPFCLNQCERELLKKIFWKVYPFLYSELVLCWHLLNTGIAFMYILYSSFCCTEWARMSSLCSDCWLVVPTSHIPTFIGCDWHLNRVENDTAFMNTEFSFLRSYWLPISGYERSRTTIRFPYLFIYITCLIFFIAL